MVVVGATLARAKTRLLSGGARVFLDDGLSSSNFAQLVSRVLAPASARPDPVSTANDSPAPAGHGCANVHAGFVQAATTDIVLEPAAVDVAVERVPAAGNVTGAGKEGAVSSPAIPPRANQTVCVFTTVAATHAGVASSRLESRALHDAADRAQVVVDRSSFPDEGPQRSVGGTAHAAVRGDVDRGSLSYVTMPAGWESLAACSPPCAPPFPPGVQHCRFRRWIHARPVGRTSSCRRS